MDSVSLITYISLSLIELSAMIRGCDNEDTIIVKDYKEADLPAILQEFFTSVQAEVRAKGLYCAKSEW